jgi:hypothetical protein
LALNSTGDQVFYSGEYAVDGGITSVTPKEGVSSDINIDATRTVSLDLLASDDYGSHIWHIDLAEMFLNSPTGIHGCYVWGLVTPSS